LPTHYGFVAFGGALTFLLHAYQTHTVSQARKVAKIKYPQFYAEKAQMDANPDAVRFNSLQRAHGNTLESMPQLLFGATFSGVRFPITTGALLAIWVLGRFLFTIGYASGGAEKRFAYGESPPSDQVKS
ncbi:hypothetical protein BDY24DRAFT_340921, partial [Mrakia frigida]|uniref:MAPEG family protein n=1 Tax=Mrakia frigida TaxID=29902 RepID=UPI003FCBFDC1